MNTPLKLKRPGPADSYLAMIIFSSRWLQAPLYFGLIVAQGLYVYLFLVELFHLITEVRRIGENEIMLIVLGLIDVVMISNLLIMVIIGGYETFVSRLRMDDHPDIPEWLSHVNANTMKIKLALALIGISSIHLLKTFINIDHLSEKNVMWQVIIHISFLLSALAMAYTSKIAKIVSEDDH
ncbi:MAG: TIGR00645 family protein [Janthinobacterium lividum]